MNQTPSLYNPSLWMTTPRDPLYVPITCNPVQIFINSMLCFSLHYRHLIWCRNFWNHYFRVTKLSISASFIWCKRRHWNQHFLCYPSPFPIQLIFSDLIWPILTDSIWLVSRNLIRLPLQKNIFLFESQFSRITGNPVLVRVSRK